MAISPKSKYIVTYDQGYFVGWNVGIDNNITRDSRWYQDNYCDIEPDFKISDEKIIIINKVHIYDLNTKIEIHLDKENPGLKYEFLTTGDIVACHNRTISIYSSNDDWKCREYKLKNVDKIVDIVFNDKLLISVNENLFRLLDLSTFQYWKVLLDKDEKEIDIKKVMLKSSNNLMVMNINGIHRIYSNKMHVLIGDFIDYESQDFGIVGDNDEYIISLSNDKIINIHSWKQNLRRSVNLNSLLALKNIDPNNFIYIEFKGNNATLYYLYRNEPRIINMTTDDWKILLKNSDQDNDIQNSKIEKVDYNLNITSNSLISSSTQPQSKEGDDNDKLIENIFYNVELFDEDQNKDPFIENYIIPSLKTLDIFPNTEKQKKYHLSLVSNSKQEFTLKVTPNSNKTETYCTKLRSEDYKYRKVNDTTLIFYGSKELHIYTFNKKIQHYRFDIENAIDLYDNSKLNNDSLIKKQWIKYLLNKKLNQKYFLAHYGEILLKSAIKQNDIEIIEAIIDKTLEYFKENPNNNIYVLSIICKNMNYLSRKYPDFLLKYYDEMILLIDSSSQKIIYNHFDHLHSFYIELTIISGIFNSILNSISKTFNRIIDNFTCIRVIVALVHILHGYLKEFIYDHVFSKPKLPRIKLIIPFPNYVTYPSEYSLFKELFFKPKSSTFSQVKFNEFYKTWNGEAVINFKWELFGRYYYACIWLLYTIFLICFTLATSVSSKIINEKESYYLLVLSITLGFIHLSFEIRQFIWDPIKWFLNVLNWFDLGAYLLPTITSIYWICTGIIVTPLASISCLLLDIKFIFFFRAFESFGIYFAIILGVGRRIFSFLFILFLIIISFAHAFLVLLKPKSEFSKDVQGDPNDPNNPWALTTKYHQISEDGAIDPNTTLVQEPDEYTNLFSSYPDALLSMYLFLTGDRNSLAAWSPKDNPVMIILMIIFSFVIVVYLMNLFIGLLNMAIEKDNDRASYLAEKAEILKEIEMFYLLPHQRRRKDWFPDIIYYYADVGETRKAVKKLMNKETWNTSRFSDNRKALSKLLAIKNT